MNAEMFPGDTHDWEDETESLPNPIPDDDGNVRLTRKKQPAKRKRAVKAKRKASRRKNPARRKRGSR